MGGRSQLGNFHEERVLPQRKESRRGERVHYNCLQPCTLCRPTGSRYSVQGGDATSVVFTCKRVPSCSHSTNHHCLKRFIVTFRDACPLHRVGASCEVSCLLSTCVGRQCWLFLHI